jgi:hypothetical protein
MKQANWQSHLVTFIASYRISFPFRGGGLHFQ